MGHGYRGLPAMLSLHRGRPVFDGEKPQQLGRPLQERYSDNFRCIIDPFVDRRGILTVKSAKAAADVSGNSGVASGKIIQALSSSAPSSTYKGSRAASLELAKGCESQNLDSSRLIQGQLGTSGMVHIPDMIPPLHTLRLVHGIPPLHLLHILLLGLDAVMVQRDAVPRDGRPPGVVAHVAVLPHRHRPGLEREEVRRLGLGVVGRLDEGFDVPVVLRGVVDDAFGEGFAAASVGGPFFEARGGVGAPLDADGTDGLLVGGVAVEGVEEVDKGFVAGHLQVFVSVQVADPGVAAPVMLVAVVVDVILHFLLVVGEVEVLECDGGRGDAVGAGGQRRQGIVVHDVEPADAEVVVVVLEQLGELAVLVPDGHADGDVFLVIRWRILVGSSASCTHIINGRPYRVMASIKRPCDQREQRYYNQWDDPFQSPW